MASQLTSLTRFDMLGDTPQQAADLTLDGLQLTESNDAGVFSHQENGAHQSDLTRPTLMSLPQELRGMIWAEVLDPIPETTLPPSTRTSLAPIILTSRPPVLAHVCRDSRTFAQDRYKKAAHDTRKTASTSSELETEAHRKLAWVSRSTIGVLHTCDSQFTLTGPEDRFVMVHDPTYNISAETKDQLARFLSEVQDSQIMMCMGYEASVWIPHRAAQSSKLPWGWVLGSGRNAPQFVDIRDLALLQEVIRDLEGLTWMGQEDVCGVTRLRDLVANADKREEFCASSLEQFKGLWDALTTGTNNLSGVQLKRPMPKIATVLQFLIMDEPGRGPWPPAEA